MCSLSDMYDHQVSHSSVPLKWFCVSIKDQTKPDIAEPVTEKEKDNVISDKDMIKFVVQEELNRKTEEEHDLENKKNIIIYRVPEKK